MMKMKFVRKDQIKNDGVLVGKYNFYKVPYKLNSNGLNGLLTKQ